MAMTKRPRATTPLSMRYFPVLKLCEWRYEWSYTRRTISLIINHMLIVKANSSVISSGQLIVVDLIIRYGCLAISCLAIS